MSNNSDSLGSNMLSTIVRPKTLLCYKGHPPSKLYLSILLLELILFSLKLTCEQF